MNLRAQMQDCEFKLDSLTIEERRIEGSFMQRSHEQAVKALLQESSNHEAKEGSKTIEYLVKESQQLRTKIEEREAFITSLE